MPIPYNRTPLLVDTSNKTYRDNSNYFNHVQFKGLCDNQNVDTIDPNTFQEVENLYVDQDDTLSSRPKLKQHDNFGFDTIEKMWIWDDVHLIYGEKTVDNNSVVLLSDVHNSEDIISLTLTEKLNQLVRVENRIYIFLESKVYVYEDNTFTEITVSNVQDYFYIPNNKVIANGIEQEGESKNELTPFTKIAVTAKEARLFNLNIPNGKEVTFKIGGVNYTLTWVEDASYLTLGSPYITKIFDQVTVVENGTAMGIIDNKLYYSFDGVIWDSLQNPDLSNTDFIGKFGLSKDGKFGWAVLLKSNGDNNPTTGNDGLYIISLVATEYNPGDDPEEVEPSIKKYPTWRRIITPEYSISEAYAVSVDMISYDRYIAYFRLAHKYTSPAGDRYLLVAAEGLDGQGEVKQYTRREDITDGTPEIVEARVFATERIWSSSSNYLDYLFIKRSGKSLQISPITYKSSTLGNLNQNSPFSTTTNIGNMFFNSAEESKWYDCSNIETMDALFTETVDDIQNPDYPEYSDNPEVPDWVDPSLKDSDGHYIFSSNTICITYVATINKKDGDVSQPENAYSVTIIADGTKMIRPDNDHFGYFNYNNFELHLITTNTNHQSVKFKMKDRHTVLCRYGLIKDGDLYPLAIPMVKDPDPNAPPYQQYTYQTVPGEYPVWGSLYHLADVYIEGYLIYQDNFVDNSVLLFSDNMTAFYVNNQVFTNPFPTIIEATYYPEDISESNLWTGLYPQHDVETNNTQYWSKDQTLYIEDRRFTEDWKPLLYFPEINTEIRPNQITNLLVIDRGVVALFNEYEIWYITKVTEDNVSGYAYYKSRVGVGCKEGADIDIMYDGATIAYSSPRGIVGMNYQQLTQNTDQILAFLSDNISTTYYPWYEASEGQIKIFKYRFWTIFYRVGNYHCLVLDIRTASWWIWNSKVSGGFKEIYMYQDKPLILDINGQLKQWDETHEGIYKDMDEEVIDWMATSQPLGFGALNNYKRITSININNVQLTRDPFNYVLICRNYKDKRNVYSPKVVGFEQERITVGSYRTFVKRLNYIQSVKFQYTIANNSDLPIQSPISITAISTKYEIKGRIR